MKVKLTKEEKAAKLERREKLKELLGGAVDLQGVNDLVAELRKETIEMAYDEELKTRLGFSKNEERPESSGQAFKVSLVKLVAYLSVSYRRLLVNANLNFLKLSDGGKRMKDPAVRD